MKHFLFLIFTFILAGCAGLSILDSPNLPKEYSKDFVWGINGHPIWSYDYENSSLEQQLKLIKEHQFEYYRIDINTDENGNVRPSKLKRFEDLLMLSNDYQIKILPVLRVYEHLEKVNFEINTSDAFEMGYSQMKGFVMKYGSQFEYYELGNEMDIKTIKEKKLSGSEITDYKIDQLELIANYLKGMVKALRDFDSNSKILINISGWMRWGFIEYMIENGVEFDILSYHWYSERGFGLFDINDRNINLYSTLINKFHKPIWITEINKYNGSKNHTEIEQAKMMELFIDNLKHKPFIEGFFVYELYDQPYHATQEWVGFQSSDFGIVGWKSDPPNYEEYYYKPISSVLKFKIEEDIYGYKDYLKSVMRDFYNVKPSETDLEYWVLRLNSGNDRETTIRRIYEKNETEKGTKDLYEANRSPDYIDSVYQSVLKRGPSEKESKYWLRFLKKDNQPNELVIKLLMSEEYWNNAIWNGYEERTGFRRPKPF